jgi:hypothetical protein
VSCLITNLPTTKVWVRKEYLRDLKDGHGEFVEGVWVSAKSIPGRAFYGVDLVIQTIISGKLRRKEKINKFSAQN